MYLTLYPYTAASWVKKFEKYDNEKILNAIKLLEPEDYEVAEFKLKEQDDKYNELNILNAKYKDEFNKSSGNMHVLDFIPNNVAVQNTLDALLLANCFTKDRIVELLRENYSNEVDIAIEEYIKKGNILQANLVELQGKINSLKKKLNLDYVDNTEHFPDKIVEDVAVNSKTVGSNYNLNELYDIAPIINKASLNLIDNSYFYKSPVVIIFMTDSGIEQKSEDGNEWVLFGEGNANNGSQTFGQNCNTRVKMGVDILLFKMVNNRTCKFKGVANYVSYRERIDKISNKSRTIINFTLRLV